MNTSYEQNSVDLNDDFPFIYIPVTLQTHIMGIPNTDLKHAYMLEGAYGVGSREVLDWDKVESISDRQFIFDKSYEYYNKNVVPAYEEKILNNPKFSQDTKDMVNAFLRQYHVLSLNSSMYGLYFDTMSLIDDISKYNDKRAQTVVTRYFDLMSAGVMFGLLSAINAKIGGLTNETLQAKQLVFDIYKMPLSTTFTPTYSPDPLARAKTVPGIEKRMYSIPLTEMKIESLRNWGMPNGDHHNFVNDLTGSPSKEKYNSEVTITPRKYETRYIQYWLQVFSQEMRHTKRRENEINEGYNQMRTR